MIKARTWLTLLMLSVGTVAATASCGSDEATGSGASGDAGEGSLIGSAGAVGRAGASSVGDAGSGAVGVGTLGAPCGADGDCTSGLTCLTSASSALGGRGPSLGMCTLPCATNGDCSAVEVGAGCINLGTMTDPEPFCFEGCTLGDNDTNKCQARPDFACRDFSDPSVTLVPDPFCVPQCRSDFECGTGLYCNTRAGLCSKVKPTGDLPGTACDPSAATATCQGACIGFPDPSDPTGMTVKGLCADLCSIGSGCMFPADPSANAGGLCEGALSTPFGLGDFGYCEPSCACTSECKFPGDVCRAWTSGEQGLKAAVGMDGLCYPTAAGTVELDCGAGGAGGSGGAAGAGN